MENEQRALTAKQGSSYYQAIGELLFAAITCRPDIYLLALNSVVTLLTLQTSTISVLNKSSDI